MKQRPDGTLEFEPRACLACHGQTTVPGRQACPSCGGSGNGPRGGKGKCKACYGFGQEPDFAHPVPCVPCEGAGRVMETEGDTLPREIWETLPLRVYRVEREQTWNEAYLGMGCIYSVTDYGSAWSADDDNRLLAMVRETAHLPQVCQVYAEGRPCQHVAIVVTRDGYAVKVGWAGSGDVTRDGVTERALAR